MAAEELLDEGRLEECLESLQAEVRRAPAVAKSRVFLFQVYALLGQWDKSLTQLNIAAEMDQSVALVAGMYRPAIACEVFREQVVAGKQTPLIFGEPKEWIAQLVQANAALAGGDAAGAAELRRKALKSAKPSPGLINGKPFKVLVDADSRLGPLLEVIIEGAYYWVPMTRVNQIAISPPEEAHDLVWAAAVFTWTNGGTAAGLIPTRYPGSHQSSDNAIRLARKTSWEQRGENYFTGLGQRLFATNADSYPLLDIRNIMFTGNESTAPPGPGDVAVGAGTGAGAAAESTQR